MKPDPTRRTFLAGSAVAGAIAVAGCADEEGDVEPQDDDASTDDDGSDQEEQTDDGDDEPAEPETLQYEIWALDQGQDNIHFYQPGDGDDEFDRTDTLDLNELEGVPDDGSFRT